MSVLQCNYTYLYQVSFIHITVNKLSIKHNQSRHRLPRHSSHRLTHPLPGSVPLSLILKHPSPPWHVQNEVQVMLAFWRPHLLEVHGVALSQEHLIIFNMSSGARGTLSGTVVGVRYVEPSYQRIHVWRIEL